MADKLRIGVVGGGISDRQMIPNGIKPATNAELVAVCDTDPDVVAALVEKYRVAGATCIDALLDLTTVDALYIATPNNLHTEHVIKAAEAGLHVLVEKPLGRNMDEARSMIAAVDAAGVQAMEDYMMMFHPLNMQIREIVQGGDIGKVVEGRAQLTCWYPPIPGAWRQDPTLSGGGALMDMATHMYDAIEKITGSRIVEVFANVKTLTHDYRSDDSSTTMVMLENGATFTVDCHYNIPDAGAKNRLEVYGTGGSILAEGTLGQAETGSVDIIISDQAHYDAQQARKVEVATRQMVANEGDRAPYTGVAEHFADCALNNRPVQENTLQHGLHILQVALAAYKSSEERRVVAVDSIK